MSPLQARSHLRNSRRRDSTYYGGVDWLGVGVGVEGEEARNPQSFQHSQPFVSAKKCQISSTFCLAPHRHQSLVLSLTRVLFAIIGARHSVYRQTDGPCRALINSAAWYGRKDKTKPDGASGAKTKQSGLTPLSAALPAFPTAFKTRCTLRPPFKHYRDGASARKSNASTRPTVRRVKNRWRFGAKNTRKYLYYSKTRHQIQRAAGNGWYSEVHQSVYIWRVAQAACHRQHRAVLLVTTVLLPP